MRAMRLSNPSMRALADQMEREEVVRWANSLARARVTRWGGMISTPDDVLQVSSSFYLSRILYYKLLCYILLPRWSNGRKRDC